MAHFWVLPSHPSCRAVHCEMAVQRRFETFAVIRGRTRMRRNTAISYRPRVCLRPTFELARTGHQLHKKYTLGCEILLAESWLENKNSFEIIPTR